MAMHRKLDVGSILFTYPQATYHYSGHRNGTHKYRIDFKALYVHNRRERSTGGHVPKTMIATLDKLGIRHSQASSDFVYAVGCRNHIYHTVWSNLPYPSPEQIKEARLEFESHLSDGSLQNEGVPMMQVEFVQEFKEKKVSNKDLLFSLQRPLDHYLANETYLN